VNLTDPNGLSPVEFHTEFTRLLGTAFGYSAEQVAQMVAGATKADDFWHGSSGLFLIGGWLINSPGHFGAARDINPEDDPYGFGMYVLHNREDTSKGAPHDFGQSDNAGYLGSLWAAFLHSMQGREPDFDISKIVQGARNTWALMNSLKNTDIPFPEGQVMSMATNIVSQIRAGQSQLGFYDDPTVKGIMAQYSMPGAWGGDGPIGAAEGIELYEYQHGFGRYDPTYRDPWAGFHVTCGWGGCLFN
jgi:hypothetical protein